jgi:hypothetical protein
VSLYEKMADAHPSLRRGLVWCRTCGREQRVDPARCLQHGWPECCGYTMTIDAPENDTSDNTTGKTSTGTK